VLSLTSEFIPRLVYKYRFSTDGTLKGYIDWSLSHFNISDFTAEETPMTMPEIDMGDKFYNLTYCRYISSLIFLTPRTFFLQLKFKLFACVDLATNTFNKNF